VRSPLRRAGATLPNHEKRCLKFLYPVDASGGMQVIDPMGLGKTLRNEDAEVHLVVRDHGRVRRGGLIARITDFPEPCCSDPRLGFDGDRNVCQDIQFAVFAPGETGRDAVIEFATGMPLYRSAAYLFPQGDVVQAVVETRAKDR